MSKIIWFVLLLFAGAVNAAEIKACNVGADPWFSGRQVDSATEAEYVLTKPLVVESLNKEGKPSGLCTLAAGEHIVVPFGFDASISHPFATREEKMKLAWVKRCGNPIVSRFHFAVVQKAEATPVTTSPEEAPAVSSAQPVAQAQQPEKKDFYDTAVLPDASPAQTPVAEAPSENRPLRIVVITPSRRYYGYGGCCATTYVPPVQNTRSDYYMSPTIRYPDPPRFVPQPQVLTGNNPSGDTLGNSSGGRAPSGGTL